ncbi:hypothetical protein CEXT_538781 [Caerostris extrusa]|uniref:Uncharacterized protein n=1 Tax=Caerostris extrusa TaxID=172846 RepID=A0AAV4XV33_CAEEX|nr:hypothetical protein CEXT_538781 [Caerostris extrusa]
MNMQRIKLKRSYQIKDPLSNFPATIEKFSISLHITEQSLHDEWSEMSESPKPYLRIRFFNLDSGFEIKAYSGNGF